MSATDLESLKRDAAEAAIEAEMRSGMALGLGTGSTARWLLEGVAERLTDGRLSGWKWTLHHIDDLALGSLDSPRVPPVPRAGRQPWEELLASALLGCAGFSQPLARDGHVEILCPRKA